MAPGAEPGFHLAFFLFLTAVGLAQPFTILVGVAAGLLLRRWWISLAAGLNLWMLGRSPGTMRLDALWIPLAFCLPAVIWAGVVQAARWALHPRDGL